MNVINTIQPIVEGLVGGLVKGIFEIIVNVFNLLFAPLIALITSIIPDFSTILLTAMTFISTYIFTSVRFVMSLLHNLLGIPRPLMVALTSYFIFLITGKVITTVYISALNIYQKLKP